VGVNLWAKKIARGKVVSNRGNKMPKNLAISAENGGIKK
jgi:hypothetical protein